MDIYDAFSLSGDLAKFSYESNMMDADVKYASANRTRLCPAVSASNPIVRYSCGFCGSYCNMDKDIKTGYCQNKSYKTFQCGFKACGKSVLFGEGHACWMMKQCTGIRKNHETKNDFTNYIK